TYYISTHTSYASYVLFSYNKPPTTQIYTLSLHDALPISEHDPDEGQRLGLHLRRRVHEVEEDRRQEVAERCHDADRQSDRREERSEEHTSELQSLAYLVCRLLLEKKKKKNKNT